MAAGGFATSRGSEYEYNNENGFRRRSASPLLFVPFLFLSSPRLATTAASSFGPFSSSSLSARFGLVYTHVYSCVPAAFGNSNNNNNNKTKRVTVPVKLPPRTELKPCCVLSAAARSSDASRSVGLCHSSWRDYARLPDRITAPNRRSTGQ